MASSFESNPRGRSQQAAGADARARDPWEDAAAALRSRTPSEPWDTGTRASPEDPITDAWGTGASTEAPVTNFWGPRASRVFPVTDPWGGWGSRQSPVTDGWGSMAAREAPITWGTRPSTEALITNFSGPSLTDGWGTMASREATVTDTWGTRASEAARGTWGHDPSDALDSWGRGAPERSRFTVPPPSESEVLMNITVGNAKAFLHCGACSLPLKPPIFQRDAGHAVCLACRDDPLGGGAGPGYRWCRFMDGLVESLRVACPNAARGCDATPAYYDLHAHRTACAHAPGTRCPVPACAFVAPMAELLDHFAAVHGWPLTVEERAGKSFDVVLCDGFNVVAAAVRDGDGSNQQHLLLLNVARQPFGRKISAVCIHPQPAVVDSWAGEVTKTVELELRYWAARHYQESQFRVPFVYLANGLSNDLAQFVVPKSVHPEDYATILVTAFLSIK